MYFLDWFYFIKYYIAKKEVKAYVEKSRKIIETLGEKIETEISVSRFEVSVTLNNCDIKISTRYRL